MVEGARLESVYRGNSIEGSNPSVSAMFYLVKTPGWLKKIYKAAVWQLNGPGKTIYLSFDDGPHPQLTPFILDELKKYNARATFFCLGKNVAKYPEIYKRILEEGHATGNHGFEHLDGWNTKNEAYLANIEAAAKYIDTRLFRPPYGRIKRQQLRTLSTSPYHFTTIMWTVLSGDFDERITTEKCYSNVIKNTKSGSIVVFHDNSRADIRVRYSLPLVLKYFDDLGYTFEKITAE